MKIKDIIKRADLLLQTNIMPSLFEKQSYDGELLAEQSVKPLSVLIACTNLVLTQVATEYHPLVYKETLIPDNYLLDYSTFRYYPITILRIQSCNGRKVSFRYRTEGIYTELNEPLSVVYSYRPTDGGFLDNAAIGSSILTEQTLAYGVAAEYCLISGNYQDALLWDRRYKDALATCCVRRRLNLPARRFL